MYIYIYMCIHKYIYLYTREQEEGEHSPSKMLTSSANQYLRPEYLTPLPTTVSVVFP